MKDFPVCPVEVRNITDTLRHGREPRRFDEEGTGGVEIHLGQKSGDHPLPADGTAQPDQQITIQALSRDWGTMDHWSLRPLESRDEKKKQPSGISSGRLLSG